MRYRRCMSPLIATIAFVFGLVALGYCCAWTGYLRPQIGDALTEFVVAVALPVLLFRTMIQMDFANAAPWLLWMTYFSVAAVIWTVSQLTVVHLFGREKKAGVVAGVAGAFSNLLLLGLPLMASAFGRQGTEVLSLIIAVHLPVMMAASIVLMAWAQRDEAGPVRPARLLRDFSRNLFGNPLILGILAGLAWRIAGLPMPEIGSRFVDTFAALAGPVALFAMGVSLRSMSISGDLRPGIALSTIKLILMPALMLGLAKLTGLPPLPAKIAVVAAAMPTGVNPYLIATRFGIGRALASNTMTIGTAAAVLTSAFWLIVAERVFG